MADFLNQVFNPNLPFEKTLQLIQLNRSFKGFYVQDGKYHDVLLSKINSLLSTPSKRVHGFLLIQEYLLEMPKDLIKDDLKNWASFCVSYIEGSNWDGKDIALQLFDKLLQSGYDDDATRRKFSLHFVSSTVEYVVRNNIILSKCSPSIVFKFLLTCILKYSGSCGSKKNLIMNFIVKNIHECPEGNEILTSLLANIHYCPTPGQSGLTSKNGWFDHFCSLLVNLNAILTKVATWGVGFEDLTLTNKNIPLLLTTNEKEDFIGRVKLETNFRVLSSAIIKMLKDNNNAGLTIPISSIFKVILRASHVKLGTLYPIDPCLSLMVFTIQMDCLQILEQLISTCKRNLQPYSKFFYQIITAVLENSLTNSNPVPSTTPLVEPKICIFDLKVKCYKVITKWFSTNGPNMYIDKDSSNLILKHSMLDLKLSEKSIELRNIKDKNSKAPDSGLSIPFIKEKLNLLHLNCLKANKSLVANCFINLPVDQLNFFGNFIVEEILSLYRSSLSSTILYENPQTRRELISLAVVLCLESEIIPLSTGLTLIQTALNCDLSSQIRDFCFESLRAFNGVINPIRILRIDEVTRDNCSYLSDSWFIQSNDQNGTTSTEENQNERNLSVNENVESSNLIVVKEKLQEEDADVDMVSNSIKEPSVIVVQQIDDDSNEKERNNSTENDDCIFYDPEESGGEDVKQISRDDDLEIVDVKPKMSIKRDDIEIDGSNSPVKRTKIVQEDSQSQSSNRSLTIIETSNHGETNGSSSVDIIKDFIAD